MHVLADGDKRINMNELASLDAALVLGLLEVLLGVLSLLLGDLLALITGEVVASR